MAKKYDNLDGLRAYACGAIVLMHVLDNGKFELSGFLYDTFIFSFTNFTFLFMILSAFSMCCGYYKKFRENSVSLEVFYKRRYQRVWPFFAILCTLELIIDHSLASLYEWFADLSMVFGLIPNNGISVVGVGWFIGIVFVFYMIYPFFVFAIGNKKRAWLVLGISVMLNILCQIYFTDIGGRTNIIYSSMFFVAGGLLYLYKEKFDNVKVVSLILLPILLMVYYVLNDSDIVMLIIFALMTVICVSFENRATRAVFQNRLITFWGTISMEVYLCHMFVFRLLEKVKLIHLTNNEVLNYSLTCIITLLGAFIVSSVLKKIIDIVGRKFRKA